MTYRRCICHPDDLPGVGISSGWVTANSFCHPDDILFHFMSSGWPNWGWFLIRMSYGNVIMSSGWHTLPFLSHPDEIANFDFPQHAVALQRFRSTDIRSSCCSFLATQTMARYVLKWRIRYDKKHGIKSILFATKFTDDSGNGHWWDTPTFSGFYSLPLGLLCAP